MKVLLYTGSLKLVSKSGVGEAVRHQKKALALSEISYTESDKEEYDLVHLNTIFPDSLWMSFQAKRQGKKVIYYAHSTMEDFKNSFRGSNFIAPLFKRWITTCYNSGDLIITPTDYSKKLLEAYDLKKPVFSLSNGIDVEFFCKSSEARQRFRAKYQLSEEEKVIISVGHYIERKGITDFIAIAESMPEYQFYWFGFTSLAIVPQIVKTAIKMAPSNVHFPGYVDRNELRDAYSGSDLFLFLTYEETEGIVLLEALASRIPVLVRDIAIYSEWLIDGETVYKAAANEEFQEKIKAILENRLSDLTEAAHEIVLKNDIKAIGEKLTQIYEDELLYK